MPTADELRFSTFKASVERAVAAGQAITVSRNDKARRFGRYLDTQKRFIGMNATTFILTASIAVLGGPIAAAVTLGGTFLALGLSTAWDRWSVSRSKGKYLKKKAAGLSAMKTETLPLAAPVAGGPVSFESQKVDDTYSEVMDDVKNMLAKQGMTDVYNALANLDSDFQRLKKFISSPQIEGPWIHGTFGATRQNTVKPMLTRTSAAIAGRTAGTVRLLGCTDAVQLWETLKLVDNRFETLRETLAMFDEFVMYTSMTTSQWESDDRKILPEAWRYIEKLFRSPDGKTVNCKAMFDMFNTAIKKQGIQHYAGRRLFGRDKDYCVWVYSCIPDFVKAGWDPGMTVDMNLEMLRRTDVGKFEQARKDIAIRYVEAKQRDYLKAGREFGQELVKGYLEGIASVDIPTSWDEAGEVARDFTTSAGISVGSAFLTDFLNGLQSDAWNIQFAGATQDDLDKAAGMSFSASQQHTAKGVLDPVTFSQGFTPQHALSIATTVVKVAVEVANAAWNEHKLATGNTFGLTTGTRQQTMAERIGTLRTFAKKEIEDYISNVEEWKRAHTILRFPNSAQYGIDVMGAFLVFQKCVDAKYSNRTGQFFEELVAIANEMSVTAENQVNLSEEAIRKFIAGTTHSRTCRGERYCYGPATTPLRSWLRTLQKMDTTGVLATVNVNTLGANWDDTPARPLEGDALETFKQAFISTLPKHVQQRAWELEYGEDY